MTPTKIGNRFKISAIYITLNGEKFHFYILTKKTVMFGTEHNQKFFTQFFPETLLMEITS